MRVNEFEFKKRKLSLFLNLKSSVVGICFLSVFSGFSLLNISDFSGVSLFSLLFIRRIHNRTYD